MRNSFKNMALSTTCLALCSLVLLTASLPTFSLVEGSRTQNTPQAATPLQPSSPQSNPTTPTPAPSSEKSKVLMDLSTGTVFKSEKPEIVIHQSNANYLMMALLVAEKQDLTAKHTITENGYADSTNTLSFKAGDKITTGDLLSLLILRKSTFAAKELTVIYAGKESDFVKLMNNKAKELSLNSTVYTNTGYETSAKQKTGAKDLALLVRACMRNEALSKIMTSKKMVITKESVEVKGTTSQVKKSEVSITPLNPMTKSSTTGEILFSSSFHSKEYGNIYAAVAKPSEDNKLIGIITENDIYTAIANSKIFMEYGTKNTERALLYEAGANVGKIKLKNGNTLSLISRDGVCTLLPLGYDKAKLTEKIVKNKDYNESISNKTDKQSKSTPAVVAYLNIYYEGKLIASGSLFSSEDFITDSNLSEETVLLQNTETSGKILIIKYVIMVIAAFLLWRIIMVFFKSLKRSLQRKINKFLGN